MENKSDITLIGLLGLLFVALKLCGVIDWNWVFVLLPFYPRVFIWLDESVKEIIHTLRNRNVK